MGAVGLLHFAAGALLVLAAWLVPRRVARARRAALSIMLLDVAPIALGAGWLGLATGRPLFAGLVMLALGAGFALVDYTMRETLREPVVFSAAAELPQVFTHPHLYLPFAGPVLVLGGAAAAILGGLALLVVEPPLWTPRLGAALVALALIAACGWLAGRGSPPRAKGRAVRRRRCARTVCDAARPHHHCPGRAEGPAGGVGRPGICAGAGQRGHRRFGGSDRHRAVRIVFRRAPPVAAYPARPPARVRCLLRVGGALRPVRRAGLGRLHDARRIRGPQRGSRKRTRLRPVQSLLCPGASAARIAGVAAAPGRVSHDLPAPVRPALFPARSGTAGARLRTVP